MINNIVTKELEDSDTYKYLGQDESVSYDVPLNKDKVTREYLKDVKKVWNSQLSAANKSVAHNVFAVPVITPTIGILNWTRDEIDTLDVRTRKYIAMSGSLHKRSDVERLYAKRILEGRGLTSMEDTYTSRTVALASHINKMREANSLLQKVFKHEENNLFRLADKLKEYLEIDGENMPLKQVSQKIRAKLKENHLKNWQSKVTHGYNHRLISENPKVDEKLSTGWLQKSNLSSHKDTYWQSTSKKS